MSRPTGCGKPKGSRVCGLRRGLKHQNTKNNSEINSNWRRGRDFEPLIRL